MLSWRWNIAVQAVCGQVEHAAEVDDLVVVHGPDIRQVVHQSVALPAVEAALALVGSCTHHRAYAPDVLVDRRLTYLAVALSLDEAVLLLVPQQSFVVGVAGEAAHVAQVDVGIGDTVEVQVLLTDRADGLGQLLRYGGLQLEGERVDTFLASIDAHVHLRHLAVLVFHLLTFHCQFVALVLHALCQRRHDSAEEQDYHCCFSHNTIGLSLQKYK